MLTATFIGLMALLIAYPVMVALVHAWGKHLRNRARARLRDEESGFLARRAAGAQPLIAAAGRLWTAGAAEARQAAAAATPEPAVVKADGADRRRHRRRAVHVLGRLAHTARNEDCDVLDLSVGGARVRSSDPAPSTIYAGGVTLHLDRRRRLPAEVVWRQGDQLGLRFAEPAAAAEVVAPFFARRKVA